MSAGRTIMLLPVLVVALAATAGAQNTRVEFERTGYRLTALGARTTVNARVLNGNGRPVANAPVRFRVDDPDIATVNERGVVLSRTIGRTRVWAVSGSDSASALLIVDQWAARFTFNPAVVRLDAVGQRARLQVQARDAAGNAIAGISGNCRVKDEGIVQLMGSQVIARGNGVTWVRCTDRGIADSARIEVRQRPLRIAIEDKNNVQSVTVGEPFELRLRAFDAEGSEIRDPRPTWASLDPRSVNVDPLTGRGRAVGASDGPVKVVAQYGDVTDTVAITVRPGSGLGVVSMAGATTEQTGTPTLEAPRSAILRLDVLSSTAVGDTMTVTVTARDASGASVAPAQVRIRSTDTSIVVYIGGQRVVGRKEGAAYLIGVHESLTDSALVTVRAAGTAAAASAESETPFERPAYDLIAAQRRNREQLDSARSTILASSPIRSRMRQMIALSVTAGQVSHASRATVHEERSGLLFGGTGALMPFRMLTLTGELRSGTLSPKGSTSEDMRVTEFDGGLNFSPTDWLTFRTGYALRLQVTETATQHWKFASVSGLFRFRFVGGALSTVFGGSLLPWAEYTGHVDDEGNPIRPDPTSRAGEAGLELSTRFLSTGLTYYVEHFSFPLTNGVQRVDQFSMLKLKFGFQIGR